MELSEIGYPNQPPIDGYGPGGFRIGGSWLAGSRIVLPDRMVSFATLDAAALEPVVAAAGEIDVVLIGQGADIAPLAPPLRTLIEGAGLGVEIMSTPSACRTYNVLLAEQRRVVAILVAL